jgi:hypothetical protein
MVNFLDGPAAGEWLQLRRVPMLLRVVQDGDEWDALDQLKDEPKQSETIHVYRRRDDLQVSKYHILTSRPRRAGSGWFWTASYSVVPDQPGDDQVRSTDAWRAWVSAWLEKHRPGEIEEHERRLCEAMMRT